MTRIQAKQIQRLTIVSQQRQDVITMDCGAFIDFFNDIDHKGRVLQSIHNTIRPIISMIEQTQDHVIQSSPSNGLKCNMVFGVCINPTMFDSSKFEDKDLKTCLLDALIECFKNCVDSIVINCAQLKAMLKGFKIKNHVKSVMETLKMFYSGEVVNESGHQFSKRFIGKITIVCENDEELKLYEKEKNAFGEGQKEMGMDNEIRRGQFMTNVNSLQRAARDFFDEKTLVAPSGANKPVDFVSVQARLMSLESTLKILESLITEYDDFSQN